MSDAIKDAVGTTSGEAAVRAVLVGGPQSLPEASRVQSVSPGKEKIKVVHFGGYEHFERAGGAPAEEPVEVPFLWTMRTKAAE